MAVLKDKWRLDLVNMKALEQRLWAVGRQVLGKRWKLPVIVMILGSSALTMRAQSVPEYQVKAAFLFNFAKFVEWPVDAFASSDAPLQICVLGQDPFARDFELGIEEKAVNGHRLEVIHPSGLPQAKACQIIFVAASEGPHLREILRSLRGANVLTVGDSAGFATMGGIINFVLDDSRVRFEINLQAAERAHLKLSARLLTVARLLVTDEETGN